MQKIMKYLILAALLFVADSSFCQNTIKLKNHIITYQSFPTDDEREVFVRYDISDKGKSYINQTFVHQVGTIDFKSILGNSYYNHSPIIVEDWNFDGHEDIGLIQYTVSGSGGTGADCHIYLYDTVDRKFIHNHQLTRLHSLKGSLKVLKNKKLIRASGYRDEPMGIYTWKDGQLVLLMENHYEYPSMYIRDETSIYADRVNINYYSDPEHDPCAIVIEIIDNDKILFSKTIIINCGDEFAEALSNIWITEED
jgi:hypothetical protein